MKKVLVGCMALALSLGLAMNAMSTDANAAGPSWDNQQVEAKAKKQPANHKGRTSCTACHKVGSGKKPMPANHKGRSNGACKACHKPA